MNGRLLGRQVGKTVFEQAQFYVNGGLETESLAGDASKLDAPKMIDNQFDNLSATVFDSADLTEDINLNRDILEQIILSENGILSFPATSTKSSQIYFDEYSSANSTNVGLGDAESADESISDLISDEGGIL